MLTNRTTISLKEHQTLTLNCTVNGLNSNETDIDFYFNNICDWHCAEDYKGRETIRTNNGQTCLLNVSKIAASQGGEYQCYARIRTEEGYCHKVFSQKLIVAVLPAEQIKDTPNLTAYRAVSALAIIISSLLGIGYIILCIKYKCKGII